MQATVAQTPWPTPSCERADGGNSAIPFAGSSIQDDFRGRVEASLGRGIEALDQDTLSRKYSPAGRSIRGAATEGHGSTRRQRKAELSSMVEEIRRDYESDPECREDIAKRIAEFRMAMVKPSN